MDGLLKKNSIKLSFILLMVVIFMCSCAPSPTSASKISENKDVKLESRNISKYLVYDETTYIVYIYNEVLSDGGFEVVYTPYYSSNGYLMRYDVKNNSLCEVIVE